MVIFTRPPMLGARCGDPCVDLGVDRCQGRERIRGARDRPADHQIARRRARSLRAGVTMRFWSSVASARGGCPASPARNRAPNCRRSARASCAEHTTPSRPLALREVAPAARRQPRESLRRRLRRYRRCAWLVRTVTAISSGGRRYSSDGLACGASSSLAAAARAR